MNQEEQIIWWSDKILLHLLELKKDKYPELTFWLRRNSSDRLRKGYWFQGSFYISIGLVQSNDTKAKLKEVALVFNFDNEEPTAYMELSFRSEEDENIINCYQEIIKKISGFNQRGNQVSYHKFFKEKDPIKILDSFFENDWKIFLDSFKKHKLLKELLISEDKFEKSLNRTLEIRRTRTEIFLSIFA